MEIKKYGLPAIRDLKEKLIEKYCWTITRRHNKSCIRRLRKYITDFPGSKQKGVFRNLCNYVIIQGKKGCDRMGMAEFERKKDEKINGVIYDMSPAPGYQHGIINGNIYAVIKQGLRGSICLAYIENLDFKYHPDINDDYLCPDIMIICDRKHLKGGAYSGVPKFIVETLSPLTAKRDRVEKKDIYEASGVEEYWIVSPQGKSVEIYYLEDGKYILEQSYILQNDKEDENYNAETEICLKAFPHIKMILSEIFEGLE